MTTAIDNTGFQDKTYDSWSDYRVYAAAALAILYYVALWGIYRPYNIDDPWFLAYSYSLCHRQSELDLAFGNKFPNGMGGTIAFGKFAAYAQCAFFDRFGWTRTSLEVLSKLVSFAGLGLLSLFLARIGVGRRMVLCYGIAFIVLESFFGMASQAKYECFVFLLMSGSLLLASLGRPFMAGFVAALAVEIQPMGIVVPVLAGTYLAVAADGWHHRRRALAALTAGTCLAVPVYLLLHPNILSAFNPVNRIDGTWLFHPGFLYSYFWETQYKRHLPELAVFAAAVALYIRRRDPGPGRLAFAFAAAATAASFLLKWPNYHYTVFWYWAALLLVFQVAGTSRRASFICLAAALYLLPQYGYVYARNRAQGLSEAHFASVRSAIHEIAGTQEPVPVFGDYTIWFAMPELFTVANRENFALAGESAVVACLDDPPVREPQALTCSDIRAAFDLVAVREIDLNSIRVKLFVPARPDRPEPDAGL
ncbi:hypothetical protein [Skermanella pratensis]|uniref:hypothetical protein n=1 Tax=Skermanella pratensis TaxID=2233999 RepID=UPI001300D5A5|nr:hypothetical protein [Skermanella pratensis]